MNTLWLGRQVNTIWLGLPYAGEVAPEVEEAPGIGGGYWPQQRKKRRKEDEEVIMMVIKAFLEREG